MIDYQVATQIARAFDSDLDEENQMLSAGMWLAQLDELLRIPVAERVRYVAVAIRLAVADEGDGEITLAFSWRDTLSALTDSHRLMELAFKGWYAVNAARRIATASNPAQALRREHTYHRQHIEAAQHRAQVRQHLTALEQIYGPVLGWYSVLEPSTTPECRDAHGKNFNVAIPPVIGYPGMVHGKCKCTAGAPHEGAEMLAA